MYDVLVGIDDDENRALAQARAVANLPRASEEVHAILMHVFVNNPTGGTVSHVGAVRRANDLLDEAGVSVSLEEGSGDPSSTILEMATGLDVDLVCVAGRKRSPAGKALFGSVTQGIVRGIDRPVMVCGVDDRA